MPRTIDKRHKILADLRHQMRLLAPGERLPTRAEFEQRYQASPVTIQRVCDRLIRDGYIESHGRNGSFVAEYPPHAHRYWLVFPHDPMADRSSVRRCLIAEAERLSSVGPDTIDVYCGQPFELVGGKAEQLLYDVRTGRTAGLIYAQSVGAWRCTPLEQNSAVPRVSVGHGNPGEDGMPSLAFDRQSLVRRAVDYLKSVGCQRVALLAIGAMPRHSLDDVNRTIADHGMVSLPYWLQYADPYWPHTARNAMHLLSELTGERRPDSLLILDDNLVFEATQGLADSGAREIEVVAHCNYPHITPSVYPVCRIGYDLGALLRRCIGMLTDARAGRMAEPKAMLPALLLDELQARSESLRTVTLQPIGVEPVCP